MLTNVSYCKSISTTYIYIISRCQIASSMSPNDMYFVLMITTKFLEAFGSYGTAESVVWAWIGKLATDHWVRGCTARLQTDCPPGSSSRMNCRTHIHTANEDSELKKHPGKQQACLSKCAQPDHDPEARDLKSVLG